MNFEIAPKSTEIRLNWFDAKLYCFSLNIDGKTGWRLPDEEELNEIYESENDFDKKRYWSFTEHNISYVWCKSFNQNGIQTSLYKENINSVRAVCDL
jgi:hypothetical protein